MKFIHLLVAGMVMISGAAIASDTVKQAQEKLGSQGYEAGPADGKWGPKTQQAVKKFQQDKGISASGRLDPRTLAALSVEQNASTGAAGESSPANSSRGTSSSSSPSPGQSAPGTSAAPSNERAAEPGAEISPTAPTDRPSANY